MQPSLMTECRATDPRPIRDAIGVRILNGSGEEHPRPASPKAEARVRELEAEVAKLRQMLEQIREDPTRVSDLVDKAI